MEEDLCARVTLRSVNGNSGDLQCDLSCLMMDRHVVLHPQQNYLDDLLVSLM